MAVSDGIDHGTVEAELRHPYFPLAQTEADKAVLEVQRAEANIAVTSTSLRRRVLVEGNGMTDLGWRERRKL